MFFATRIDRQKREFRRAKTLRNGERRPVLEECRCLSAEILRQRPCWAGPKHSKTAQKWVIVSRFCLFLHAIRVVLATVRTVISDQLSGGMNDAGEGAEIGTEETGCGDAALPARRNGEESDQSTAAGGAAGAACSGGGDRGEDGGVPFGGVRFEARELRNTITLRSMSRMAQAMGCKVVYGIVPVRGKTLDELAEERLWASVLGNSEQ